ncbi:bactericidal permeability-increasing protein-like [Rhineura floridana]|uniref:bactericidal permeability-increasing protein-like n=1 Tax=Rhineura floridana TaxID=261503 RepID=UPI002AC81575|nr:bactericidal permeability-increasing protein-like [Rhineura floridana]
MSKGNLFLACLLVFLYYLVLSEGTSPGFVGRITDKGLDYAGQEGVAALQQKLASLTLPDVSGSVKAKPFGHIKYKFYSLNVHSFQLPSSAIAPIPGVGLKVSISNAFAELRGKWQVKKRFFKDHGSFDLKTEGISISVGLKLGSDAAGRPTATTADCTAHISNVKVHFSGGLSWLYNLFRKKVESALRRTMEGQVCEEVTSSVSTKLQPFLQTLPVTAKLDKVAGIDYSLVGPPVATQDSLDLDLKGEFFSLAHRSAAPFQPPALAFPVDHDRMLYFGISSYFFNTAGLVYHSAGALTFSITDDMVPKEFKIRLNTTSFGAFVPQLEKVYPNMLMKLQVSPPSAPSVTIAPGVLSLSPTVDIQAFAILPNSSLAPLFVISASTTISTKVTVNSTRIFGSLKLGRLQLSLKHSDVGPFSVQLMQALMNYYAGSILIPQINARLAEGFPLPLLDHVQLSNTILQIHQDFLLFGADVHYS